MTQIQNKAPHGEGEKINNCTVFVKKKEKSIDGAPERDT